MIRLLWALPRPRPEQVEVVGERFHYLTRVLRLREGDALQLFDGAGHSYAARVLQLLPEQVTLSLGEELPVRTGPDITIVQGIPKGERMEWILQKGTELGAAAFAPVVTERTVVKLAPDRAEDRVRRWTRIAEEAARQCGRADTPRVEPVRNLVEAGAQLKATTRVVILDEEEHARSLSQAIAELPTDAPIALVIGPEGGLTRDEVHALTAQGAVATSLGHRVLRTETASLAALSILLHLRGELG